MLKKLLILVFTILISTSTSIAAQLRFVQVTDSHLSLSADDYRGRNVTESVDILKNAINSINSLSDISFVIFSGDNIDQSKEDNLKTFCEITKSLKRPYYVALGNHDAYKVSGIDKTEYLKTIKQYDKYQKGEKFNYFFFPNKDFIVIVLDGSTNLIPSSHGNYLDTTLSWLDKTLTKYQNKKAVIIQHFPIVEPQENKSHRVINTEKYFEVLNKHPNSVLAILSGHYHVGKITESDGITHISTPALINKPHGYRLVEINYDEQSIFNKNPKFEIKTKIINLEKPE